jgi:Glycosyltransferases involved in cell wall biogenesis
MPLLDVFMLINNEEELVQYALESICAFGDLLGVVSLVDNNSTDASMQIVDSFRDKLNIVLQHHYEDSNHGRMRNLALSKCTSEWIYYLDSDESFTSDFPQWLRSSDLNRSPSWKIYKYTTIIDCFHYVEGGNGPTERLFKNVPGVGFPQDIHTEPTGRGLEYWLEVPNVLMFDHTACKSREALWAKGFRYQWAARKNIPAIGSAAEYINRVDDALINKPERNVPFNQEIRNRIFTGPGFRS